MHYQVVEFPPLEEVAFRIRAYDSSSKKLVGISTIMITIGVRKIETKLQVVDSKLSYNMFLGRPCLHDMDGIPSTLYGKLKFEFHVEVHTILGDLKPCALCNIVDFDDLVMTTP